MIDIGALHMRGCAIGDREQFRDARLAFLTLDPGEALAQRLRHHAGHALAGRLGDGLRRSEEHTSELQSLMRISYAVFCLKKQNETSIRALMHSQTQPSSLDTHRTHISKAHT